MYRRSLSVVFAGSGGSGAMTAGTLFLRAAAKAGYYGQMTKLFGPQVRGGEAAALVQVAVEPIACQPDMFDLFIALDWEKVEQFAAEIPLGPTSVIIADPSSGTAPPRIAKSGARRLDVRLGDAEATRLEVAIRGRRSNVFAAALAGTLAGVGASELRSALTDILGTKSVAAIEQNSAALAAGIARAVTVDLDYRLSPPLQADRWLITGNEAVSVGVLRGGVRFVGCYPITPATELVEWMAPELQKLGGRLVLAEDEMAAINMALGASFGGVPAMTVTSGPGLSLMVETIGLAVAAEVPLVVVNVMRGGPSTGIPSKTEQSDLNIAIYGGHGDAPRVVMAPTSIADCMLTAEWAVYVAESLQTPVIVLSDQAFGQASEVIDPPSRRPEPLRRLTDGAPSSVPFKRYAIGSDPITPMPPPGMPGHQWVGEGLTHNEVGLPVGGAAAHVAQIKKRARKLADFEAEELWGEVWGEGDTVIVTFGSSIGPARAAAKQLTAAGLPTRVVGLRLLAPLPAEALATALEGARRIVVLEQNHSAQLFHYLLGQKAIPVLAESLARPGPLPFRPAEITAHLA
jgi:2-oxoglutarate ferredoxin oxidoreductase subunit alpha